MVRKRVWSTEQLKSEAESRDRQEGFRRRRSTEDLPYDMSAYRQDSTTKDVGHEHLFSTL
jgi:hypothetical protein